jgi:hypothetical protein
MVTTQAGKNNGAKLTCLLSPANLCGKGQHLRNGRQRQAPEKAAAVLQYAILLGLCRWVQGPFKIHGHIS